MPNIIPFQEFGLVDKHGSPMVGSRAVAEKFRKEHKNVLQSIDKLECSKEFNRLNFQPVTYKDEKGEKRREVLMTRDGFTFLAMGFTGKKAAEWKEKYIAAFNSMEKQLTELATARLEYRPMTDAIQAAHDPAKFYHYTTENDMLYRIVLGMSSKKFREQHGLPEGVSPKAYMTPAQISLFTRLQKTNTDLITMNKDYEYRKAFLTELAAGVCRAQLKRISAVAQ